MNPIMIMAVIGVGALGLTMLARKTNAAVQWINSFWARRVQLPPEYAATPPTVPTLVAEEASGVRFDRSRVYFDVTPGTVFYAADGGVVTVMNPMPGAAGAHIMGVSSVGQDLLSFEYVGLIPDAGLGNVLRRGDILGHAAGTQVVFSVRQSRVPCTNCALASPARWLRNLNVQPAPGYGVIG